LRLRLKLWSLFEKSDAKTLKASANALAKIKTVDTVLTEPTTKKIKTLRLRLKLWSLFEKSDAKTLKASAFALANNAVKRVCACRGKWG